jgi:hypothetical protein
MHSVPNFMPMKASAVQRMRALLSRFDYADVMASAAAATSSATAAP